MTNKPLRVIPWLAVSSLPQAADEKESLPRQQLDILEDPLFKDSLFVDTIRIPGHSRAYSNFDRFVAGCMKQGMFDPERMYAHLENRDFDVLVVRDSTRLGREWGIFGELVQLIIDSGARIYVQNGFGWVDETNVDAFIITNGLAAKKQVRDLVKYRAIGMPARAKRGLNVGPKPVWSHRSVFDDKGNEVRTEVDRSRQRLWDDLAALILEGIPWNMIELELASRYGHTDANGKPYKSHKFYDLIHTPMFWGHGAWKYRSKGKPNKTKDGFWVFDPEYPPPDDIIMYYDAYQAVYTGETAERVKSELRRRRIVAKGHFSPRFSKPFSGLLVCDECAYNLSFFHSKNAQYNYYRCISVYKTRTFPERTCTQRKLIHVSDIQDAIQEILVDLFANGIEDLYARVPSQQSNTRRKEQLEKELTSEKNYYDNLRRQQARQPDSMAADYDVDIREAHQKVQSLQTQLRGLSASELRTADVYALQVKELQRVKLLGLPQFWTLPQTEINQALHNIFGRFRLVVSDGEVVSLTPAPNFHRNPYTG